MESPTSPQAEACAGEDGTAACCAVHRKESSHAVTADRAFIFASTSVSAATDISEGRGGPVKPTGEGCTQLSEPRPHRPGVRTRPCSATS